MRNLFSLFLLGIVTQAFAASRAIERRVAISTEVFVDRMESAEFIPQDVLDQAECIASVRNVKAGFLIGGEGSTGLVSCRVGKEWSEPSFFNAGGGKLGLLVGGQVSNNVLLFMTPLARKLLNGTQFELGVDLSFALGPVGGGTGASVIPAADILTYSAGVGLYAGFSLDGTIMGHGESRNAKVYGSGVRPATLLATPGSKAPAVMGPYIDALTKYAK